MSIFKTLANKLFAVNDGNVYDRAAMGDLDDYTGPNGVNSPAQFGFRAVDQNGNAIFDSMGLIAVMSYIGGGALQSSDTTTSLTAVSIGTGVSLTFNLNRAAYVLHSSRSISKSAGGAGQFGYVELYLDGVFDGNVTLCDKAVGGFTVGSSMGILSSARLAKGQHTVELMAHVDNAALTWTNAATSFQLFLAGA